MVMLTGVLLLMKTVHIVDGDKLIAIFAKSSVIRVH
jgi:hypothetical protein